jgi:hypothetical protein
MKLRAKDRKIPECDITSDYTSPLLTFPDMIASWRTQFGYTNQQIGSILEYFEQVAQLKGQKGVANIVAMRTPEVMGKNAFHLLHPADPLKMFPTEQAFGVPPDGFDLSNSIPYAREIPKEKSEQPRYAKPQPMFQLNGYKKTWETLPIGTTCVDIIRMYPNHLCYEFLDGFTQHGFTAARIAKMLHPAFEAKMKACGLIGEKSNCHKLLQHRMSNRRKEREKIYGEEGEDMFCLSEIQVRRSGLAQPNDVAHYQKESMDRVRLREHRAEAARKQQSEGELRA